MLRVYAPGAFAPQPCEQQLRKMRGELTIAGECIAAYRVAACLRILSFGWDESNKWGLGLLSSNMQIIERGASEPVNLVPRGATLTAADLADETLAYCRAAAVQLGGPSYEAAEASSGSG